MTFLYGMAPQFFLSSNKFTALALNCAATATYWLVWSFSQQPKISEKTLKSLKTYAIIGVPVVICLVFNDFVIVRSDNRAIAYLATICALICPMVAVLSWVRNRHVK